MKRSFLYLLLLGAIIMACSKNVGTNYTADCSTAKSYASDVSPVIQAYCATNSGCHASGSRNGVYTSYTQVFNDRSNIRRSIINGTMPQGASLTSAQKNAIICWIDSGAANN